MYAFHHFETNVALLRAHTDLRFLDDPTKDPQVRGDAFKTLFVARLSYDVSESDLEREFGRYGPIERVRYQTAWRIV